MCSSTHCVICGKPSDGRLALCGPHKKEFERWNSRARGNEFRAVCPDPDSYYTTFGPEYEAACERWIAQFAEWDSRRDSSTDLGEWLAMKITHAANRVSSGGNLTHCAVACCQNYAKDVVDSKPVCQVHLAAYQKHTAKYGAPPSGFFEQDIKPTRLEAAVRFLLGGDEPDALEVVQ